MPRAAQKPKIAPAAVLDGPDPHLHRGKCTICKHPQRAEIERAFVDWCSPLEITEMFGLKSRATIYRHARARGLFELRRRNLHFGLGRIAEHVADVKPSAANVIAAFIAMAKIDGRGEWVRGTRFDTRQACDRLTWEDDWAAVRENQLEDVLNGGLPDILIGQREHRLAFNKYKEKLAAEAAEAAKEAERKAEREKQAAQKKAASPEKPEAPQHPEHKEQPQQEPQTQQEDELAAAGPSNPPAPPVQEKKKPEPEAERPSPIPRPPPTIPPVEDRGPYTGMPRAREKIGFARRRWRPPLH
ncbi:MAG: hypothetical protein KGL59_08730 [Acidobacteriota bacterium]|nr:hypothetical protein [Acidobacteriota bacterium]